MCVCVCVCVCGPPIHSAYIGIGPTRDHLLLLTNMQRASEILAEHIHRPVSQCKSQGEKQKQQHQKRAIHKERGGKNSKVDPRHREHGCNVEDSLASGAIVVGLVVGRPGLGSAVRALVDGKVEVDGAADCCSNLAKGPLLHDCSLVDTKMMVE